MAALSTLASLPAVVALPLVEISFPWNPPSLTRLPPMYLFGGLIAFLGVALVVLYFYEPPRTEN